MFFNGLDSRFISRQHEVELMKILKLAAETGTLYYFFYIYCVYAAITVLVKTLWKDFWYKLYEKFVSFVYLFSESFNKTCNYIIF